MKQRLILAVVTAALLFTVHGSVAAKDQWIQVRSKNFYLIGNASEKDIRKVGTRLEQFRETFRQIFGRLNFTSSIATNVVVFKSDVSYRNFKPKRADGKIDDNIAGYFQSGEDVNYITLSTEGEDAQTFSTIFHEYVHFLVNTNFGKSEIPAWFNEGLAEYYETFAMEGDIKAKLGLPQGRHVLFLRQNDLMPLSRLFNTSNYQLHQTGDHSRSIFYAQSWALMHYLIQGEKGSRVEGLGKFLNFLLNDVPAEKAFQDAFQSTYAHMESELLKYVSNDKYYHQEITFKSKLLFEAEMQASFLDEASSNAYLGDLLFHANRPDDAEPFLLTALKLQPDSSMANIALGMVRIRQRKFSEAKQSLEKAIAGDPKNHLAFYRYAYLLNREGQDEFGFTRTLEKETAAKMREALRKSIVLNPAFTESYDLLAYVNLVTGEEFDEAAKMMRNALKYQPGNQRYALRLAEILSRQNKLDEANVVAEKIVRTADEPDVKKRAESLVSYIARKREFDERNAAYQKQSESQSSSGGPPPRLKLGGGGRSMTESEIQKRNEEVTLRSINESLRNPAAGERRVIGYVQKIDCKSNPIVFTIKTGAEIFTLTGKDFDSLTLNAFDPAANNSEIGCDAKIADLNAVVTFQPSVPSKGSSRGEIKAIEFVVKNFRLVTDEELNNGAAEVYGQPPEPKQNQATGEPSDKSEPSDPDARRRAAMIEAINEALQKPVAGLKREMGYLDRLECTKKEMYFHIRTGIQTLKLLKSPQQSLKIGLFTPDLEGLQLGCTLKPVEFPVVFIYTDNPDAKTKTAGEIISLQFVPKSFVLDRQ